MEKSPDAFRTISEVAELLETPAHVLRFWESRFPQIRPVKRAGGRRYYRPADVALLTGIKRLLHDDGLTIRGVQKILREQGVRHVSGVAEDAGGDDDAALEAALAAFGQDGRQSPPMPPAEAETAQIIALQSALTAPPPVTGADAPATPQDADKQDDLSDMAEDDVTEALSENAPAPEEIAGDAELVQEAPEPHPTAPPETPEKPIAELVALHVSAAPNTNDTKADDAPRDLFDYTPPDRGTPREVEPAAEAPMTLWAEAEEPASHPLAEVTVFTPAAPADPPAAQGTQPAEAPATAEVDDAQGVPAESAAPPASVATPAPPHPALPLSDALINPLAARLRALDPEALSAEDRETLGHLRQAAMDLRQRMMAPARPIA
jgi:DNA-binding transcriptional MerR regulator